MPVSPDDAADQALARMDLLRRDAREPSLALESRRRAANSLLDASREFIIAHGEDLRAAQWMADAAEDCFVTVLPLGGDLESALFGFPSHEEWRRTSTLVALMLDLSERADAAARATVTRLSDPARPIDAIEMKLLDAYEMVELPRRLPLLRGLAEALAAAIIERDQESRRARSNAALAHLAPLLDELEGEALLHASLAAMLSAGISGDAARLEQLLATARFAARDDASAQRRIDWTLARAESELNLHAAAVARMTTQIETLLVADRASRDTADTEFALRRAAMLESRLRRTASAQGVALDGRHWSEPLRAWLIRVPPARRAAHRSAMLARLADLAESEIEGMHGAPLAELAAGEALARRPDAANASLARIDAATTALDVDEPWRAAALEASSRVLLRLDRHAEATDRLIERADLFRAEPEAASAAEQAVALARALDEGDPTSEARQRLRRAIELAANGFPDHPHRGRWRVERVVLMAEALATTDAVDAASLDDLNSAIATARPALMALGDDDFSRALEARLALARAAIALASLDGDSALAALEAAPAIETVPDSAVPLRRQRVMALALVDRDLATDPILSPILTSRSPELHAALLRALRRIAPTLEPGAPASSDPRRRAAVLRLVALIDENPDPQRPQGDAEVTAQSPSDSASSLQLAAAEALRAVGLPAAALPRYRALRTREPDRADLLLGEAECLMTLPAEAAHDRERLAQSILIYQRLLGDRVYSDDARERTATWWLCHLRLLECLQRSGTERDPILARIERLRVIDAELGGSAFSHRFDSFARVRDE